MNARQFNEILKKYDIGYGKLEYESDELCLAIYNNNHEIIRHKKHFFPIIVNDSTFGFTWNGEITEDAYDYFEICNLQLYSTAWAYPEVGIEIGENIYNAEDSCGIRITDYKEYSNRGSDIDLYTEQAIKAYLNPIEYQHWLLKMYLEEEEVLLNKHYPMLKELGFRLKESDLFKRGLTTQFESALWLELSTGVSSLFIKQDLFSGKFVIHEYKNDNCYEYNINELTTEELKEYILHLFDINGEDFWQEEKEFREKYIKDNNLENCPDNFNPYKIEMFLEYKNEMA